MPPPARDVEQHREGQDDDHPDNDCDVDPPSHWGGASGSAFRSGITAKSIAAYQVVMGGWNFRLPRAV